MNIEFVDAGYIKGAPASPSVKLLSYIFSGSYRYKSQVIDLNTIRGILSKLILKV